MRTRARIGSCVACVAGVAFMSAGLAARVGAPAPAAAAVPAALGPPLLCFPFETEGRPSLPWGDDAFSASPSFDTKKLRAETLRLLSPDQPVIARMETIRRASIYLDRSGESAEGLLAGLACRALDAEASGDPAAAAAALFDAGYFVATCRQHGAAFRDEPGEELGVQGYAWVRRAVELSGGSPDMHFAAAMVLFDHPGAARDRCREHAAAAAEGAQPGSLLAKNLPGHFRSLGLATGLPPERADAERR